jgi:hypothetical protein
MMIGENIIPIAEDEEDKTVFLENDFPKARIFDKRQSHRPCVLKHARKTGWR